MVSFVKLILMLLRVALWSLFSLIQSLEAKWLLASSTELLLLEEVVVAGASLESSNSSPLVVPS